MNSKLNILLVMKWLKLSLMIAISSNFNLIAFAQEKPKTPSIPSELERLEYFEGSWICRQPANSTKASGQFSWKVKRDLNNFWYIGRSEQNQASSPDSQPISSQDFLGYNVTTQKLIRSVIVGNGNHYNMTATDWQDNKLVWSGTLVSKGQTMPLRQVMVKDSQDKFTIAYFLLDDTQTWQPLVNEACSREPQV